MRKLVLLAIVLFVFLLRNESFSQISIGGIPYSVKHAGLVPENVPVLLMPEIDIDALRAEDQITDNYKDIPWRFGKNIDLQISRGVDGVEEILLDGSRLWRIAVHSPGALTINLLFDRFHLPPGAELFVYNEDKSQILGAFTEMNNQDDLLFATTLIRGDFITVEYYEPADAAFRGELQISRVTHGYRGAEEFLKSFGNSGSCNVNVACPQSAGMEDQIRSSCMLVTGSSGFCSAALINNTAEDGKPFILSADHCYSTPGTLVFWFNWQSPTCSNPPSSPPYNSMTGAVTRARNSASDFWLMELNQPIPDTYNVFYSGWNRTTEDNISGKIWGIHHPSGDIKKISWAMSGTTTTTYLQNAVPGDGSHWRITQWSDGTTTEGGSSGSPLYDPQGRIIGQLHGGYASCSSMTSDWYGKLGVSWTGGGTDITRLSNWLDPLSTGAVTLDGYDPNAVSVALDVQLLGINAPLTAYCFQPEVQPQVVIKNKGTQTLTSATVSYILNGGTPVTINWTGTLATGQSDIITFSQITLIPGVNQTFVATVNNPNGGTDENLANNQASMSFNVASDFTAPFSEDFEGSVFPPLCWTQEIVQGSESWVRSNGGYSSNPAAAHSGSGNALLFHNSFSAATVKLITPPLKVEWLLNPVLTFWHAQVAWSGDQDELRVYYRTSGTSAWILLETYTSEVSTWTQRTIALPNPSQTYYIAFEGNAKYGYGVCVDDVIITGSNVGVSEISSGTLQIYPNPSDGRFQVHIFKSNEQHEFLTIIDVNGREVFSASVGTGEADISFNLDHPEPGLYFLILQGADHRETRKIVIY